MPSRAALGLRVKTGRAIAVVLAGDPAQPEIRLRRELSLVDPEVPASRQPYHAALGLAPGEAKPVVERAAEAVRKASHRNPHMHAHAAEGALFHDALAEAAARTGLATRSVLEKRALGEASRGLAREEPALKREIAELGQRVGPPWRADEKSACAGAWLVLGGAAP